MTVQGLFGDDTFSVTPHASVAITVQGGDPTASDTVVVTGTTAANIINFTPTATDGGTVQVDALGLVTLQTVEHLTITGLGGNDIVRTTTPATPNAIQVIAGATADSGSVFVDSLLPMQFTNTGVGGGLDFVDQGGADTLTYTGTNGNRHLYRVVEPDRPVERGGHPRRPHDLGGRERRDRSSRRGRRVQRRRPDRIHDRDAVRRRSLGQRRAQLHRLGHQHRHGEPRVRKR